MDAFMNSYCYPFSQIITQFLTIARIEMNTYLSNYTDKSEFSYLPEEHAVVMALEVI